MNTDNFSIQSSLEANYLEVKFDENLLLDEIAVKVLKNECPPFLIPFKMLNINDVITFRYKLVNTIALEYADTDYSKKDFVEMFLGLLEPFMQGKDWFLDYHCFCIDPRYIFLDKKNNKVFFIYLPEMTSKNTDDDLLDFFKKVFERITITDDPGFQVQLYKFFSQSSFALTDLKQVLEQNRNKVKNDYVQYKAPSMPETPAPKPEVKPVQVVAEPKPVQQFSANQVEEPKKKEKAGGLFGKKEKAESSNDNDDFFANLLAEQNDPLALQNNDEVINSLFGDKKKVKEVKEKKKTEPKEVKPASGGLFGKHKKAEEQPIASVQNPVNEIYQQPIQRRAFTQPTESLDSGNAQSEVTQILDDYPVKADPYLELVSAPMGGAPARIKLSFNKDFITVGRASADAVQPDIAFPKEFKAVGRKHLRIERKDGKVYVIDLGSLNHTLLNDQRMVPNMAYELQNGSKLSITESQAVVYKAVIF